MKRQTCEGKRRKQRGHVFGTFACGRKAKFTFETRVGTTSTHRTCGDGECMNSITSGYRAYNIRELSG